MPSIVALGMGTCFAKGADVGRACNVRPMRTLAWLAKDNRPPADWRPGLVHHPQHTAGAAVMLNTPADAQEYVADVIASLWARITRKLQLDSGRLVVVPIPSSNITADSALDERWPARAIAGHLAKRGLATVAPIIVNAAAVPGKTTVSGAAVRKLRARQIAENTQVLLAPSPDSHVLLLDDMITRGDRLAGSHHALMSSGTVAAVGAVCIAFSNAHGEVIGDCYTPRARTVTYEPTGEYWRVRVAALSRDNETT